MNENIISNQIDVNSVVTSEQHCDFLGSGSYGKVRRVYTTKYGTSAAKIFRVTGTTDRRQSTFDFVLREAKYLLAAGHENIVRFQAVTSWSNYIAIIMEYEAFGSLHNLLKQTLKVSTFPFKLRFRMVFEITKALKYLHNSGLSERIVHGDLKTTNILLNEDLRIRVADFGAAHIGTKTCDQTAPRPSETQVHSVVFAAPEFLDDIYLKRTTAMDIFSFGRVVYEVITRCIPFQQQQFDNLSTAIIQGVQPDMSKIPVLRQDLIDARNEDLRLLDVLVQLMNDCCDYISDNRPNAIAIYDKMEEYIERISLVVMSNCVAQVINQIGTRRPESEKATRDSLAKIFR